MVKIELSRILKLFNNNGAKVLKMRSKFKFFKTFQFLIFKFGTDLIPNFAKFIVKYGAKVGKKWPKLSFHKF